MYRTYTVILDALYRLRKRYIWIASFILIIVIQTTFYLYTSELKPYITDSWVEIAGEGSRALLVAIWWLMIIAIRPPGHTTLFLGIGLLGMFVATYHDFLDEFLDKQSMEGLHDWIESVPIGLLFFTYGIWLWSKEQRVVDQLFARREQGVRSSDNIDPISMLPKQRFLQSQVDEHIRRSDENCSVAFITIRNKDKIIASSGRYSEQIRSDLIDLLRISLGRDELLCSVSGWSFAIFSKGRTESEFTLMFDQIVTYVEHFKFRAESNAYYQLELEFLIKHRSDSTSDEAGTIKYLTEE
jgi:GGDEF domain-containing protein